MSWTPNPLIGGNWNLFLNTLAVDPHDSGTVYLGGADGLFKSTDGGANWALTSLEGWATAVAINPLNPSALLP